MTTVLGAAFAHFVAVGQQDWIPLLFGSDCCRECCHHIRVVGKIGNCPKPFRLALSAKVAARFIKSFKGGVFLRLDGCFNFQCETARRRENRQVVRIIFEIAAGKWQVVDLD